MIDLHSASPDAWLAVGEEAAEELARREGVNLRRALRDKLAAGDESWIRAFARALVFEEGFESSWVHGAGERTPYLSLDLLEVLPLGERAARARLAAFSRSALTPFDFRAAAADILAGDTEGDPRKEFAGELTAPAPRRRSREEMYFLDGDGIDHLFDVPRTAEERLALYARAAEAGAGAQRRLLARRLCGLTGVDFPAGDQRPYASERAEALIAADARGRLIRGADYLVDWNELVGSEAGTWTTAEILRMISFSPESRLPDRRTRRVLLAYFRSVLRVSGRSTVGLGAGVFHVEHGTMAAPSYFYVGRGAVIGKGTMIDAVGGFVMEESSFVGGGFSPILIHTHKHLQAASGLAAQERKKIAACVFHARRGARLPMTHAGIFETADYLGASSPYPGIAALALDAEACHV